MPGPPPHTQHHAGDQDVLQIPTSNNHAQHQQHQQHHHHQREQQQQRVCDRLPALARREALARARAWGVTLATSVCCAAMAYTINLGVEGIEKLRFVLTLPLIRPGGGLLLPWLAFAASSCIASLLAGLGVVYLAPLAAGSGIPHIKAYCNGVAVPHLLTLKTLVVKALGAMASIGSGLVAGKEGPFIQCGACIAWLLLQASERLFGSMHGAACCPRGAPAVQQEAVRSSSSSRNSSSTRRGAATQPAEAMHACGSGPALPAHEAQQQQEQQPQQERQQQQQQQWWADWRQREAAWRWARRQQDVAAVGAGAGVAAAFVAPMAGAAYAVEDAASHRNLTMLGMAFFTGGAMVLFLWVFTTMTSFGAASLAWVPFSSPLALAFQGTTGTDVRFWWYVWELPLAILLGLLGGLLSGLWTWLNTRLLVRRRAWLRRRWLAVADVVVVCLITNTIRLVVAYQSPCLAAPRPADLQALEQELTSWRFFDAPTGLYPQLWCPKGQYSMYGQLFMMPVEVAVRSMFTLQPRGNVTLHLQQQQQQQGGGGGGALATSSLMLSAAGTAAAAADLAAGAGGSGSGSGGAVAAQEEEAAASQVFRPAALAAFMVYVWGMLLLTYGISAPTGIFIPALAVGAAGGRVAGQLLRHVLRAAGVQTPICMPGWSVLGATAMLVGTTRLTLANCLIVLESSGAVPMTVPMVLLAIPAKLLADYLHPGIYDWQMEAAGYPFIEGVEELGGSARAAIHHQHVKDVLRLTAAGATQQAAAASGADVIRAGGDHARTGNSTSSAPAGAAAAAHVVHIGSDDSDAGTFALPLPPVVQQQQQPPLVAAAGAAGGAGAGAGAGVGGTLGAQAAQQACATSKPAAQAAAPAGSTNGADANDAAAAADSVLCSNSSSSRSRSSTSAQHTTPLAQQQLQQPRATHTHSCPSEHWQPCGVWQQLQQPSLGVLVTPEASLATASLIMRRLGLWELPVVTLLECDAAASLPASPSGGGAAGGGTPAQVGRYRLLPLTLAAGAAAGAAAAATGTEDGAQGAATTLACSSGGGSSYGSVDRFGTGYHSCSSRLSFVSSTAGSNAGEAAGSDAEGRNSSVAVGCGISTPPPPQQQDAGSPSAGAAIGDTCKTHPSGQLSPDLGRSEIGGGSGSRGCGATGEGAASLRRRPRPGAAAAGDGAGAGTPAQLPGPRTGGSGGKAVFALCGALRRQDVLPEMAVKAFEQEPAAEKQE